MYLVLNFNADNKVKTNIECMSKLQVKSMIFGGEVTSFVERKKY